jgi:hypothetical protein
MHGTRVDHTLHIELACGFIDVVAADNIRIQNDLESVLARCAAQVDNHVDAFHHLEDGVPVSQIADHELFVFACLTQWLAIAERQRFGVGSQRVA